MREMEPDCEKNDVDPGWWYAVGLKYFRVPPTQINRGELGVYSDRRESWVTCQNIRTIGEGTRKRERGY